MKKLVNKINEMGKKSLVAFSGITASLMPTVSNAQSFSGYSGITSDSIMNGFFQLIAVLGTFAGAFFVGTSIWGYVMSFKTEDTEARHKASLGFIPGIAFLSMAAIISLFKS